MAIFPFKQAGAVGLIFQASLLTIAVAIYQSGPLAQRSPLLFFLCLIVRTSTSRFLHGLDYLVCNPNCLGELGTYEGMTVWCLACHGGRSNRNLDSVTVIYISYPLMPPESTNRSLKGLCNFYFGYIGTYCNHHFPIWCL